MTILTPAQRATLTPSQMAKYDYGQRRTERLRAERGGLGLPMHIWIPDTQITPTSPRQHLAWAGEYVHERAAKGVPIKLILAGDWHDMESLSSYDRGKKSMENRRYSKDIKAGNAGLEEFTSPFKADANIEKWRLLGNHEFRMERAVESDATLEGTFTYDDFNSAELGYTTVPFLDTLHLDGVAYCLTPGALVLTDQLEYVPVEKLEVGDKLWAFEEDGAPRHFAGSVVLAADPIDAPTATVTLSDGQQITATYEHRWLARRYGTYKWGWVTTANLDSRYEVCRPFPVWERENTYEAGYLAGIFDGEGWITKSNAQQGGIQLGFAQLPGLVLDKALSILDSWSISHREHTDRQSGVVGVRILGPSAEKLALLGRIGAVRLIAKLRPEMQGRVQQVYAATVESVVDAGRQTVIQLATSTKTLIADGVAQHNSHYFYNPKTSRPYGGESIDTLIKTIGYTFTQGHRQDYKHGVRFLTNGQAIHGLIAGAFYLHDEDYLGPQGNHQWRGIVVKHQVENGSYDIMQVSLDYLCRKYEGMRLDTFREKYVK